MKAPGRSPSLRLVPQNWNKTNTASWRIPTTGAGACISTLFERLYLVYPVCCTGGLPSNDTSVELAFASVGIGYRCRRNGAVFSIIRPVGMQDCCSRQQKSTMELDCCFSSSCRVLTGAVTNLGSTGRALQPRAFLYR
jgi:hypothetical protein